MSSKASSGIPPVVPSLTGRKEQSLDSEALALSCVLPNQEAYVLQPCNYSLAVALLRRGLVYEETSVFHVMCFRLRPVDFSAAVWGCLWSPSERPTMRLLPYTSGGLMYTPIDPYHVRFNEVAVATGRGTTERPHKCKTGARLL